MLMQEFSAAAQLRRDQRAFSHHPARQFEPDDDTSDGVKLENEALRHVSDPTCCLMMIS
jgi:hypothetical protein